MDQRTEHIIYEELSLYFNCDISLFLSSGTTLRTPESMIEESIIVHTQVNDRSIVTGTANTVDELRRVTSVEEKQLSVDDLHSYFPDFVIDDTYPCSVYTSAGVPHIEMPAGYKIDQYRRDDPGSIHSLIAMCSEGDLDDADIDPEKPDDEIVLAWFEGTPVGYAGYRILEKSLGDIGVIVLPAHRKRGLGTALVARITEICSANGKIPLYRYNKANAYSGDIIERLGYDVFWETTVLVKK